MTARTPEEVDALFERHLNAGELDALVALYEPAATLIPNPGETAIGHAAIREALAPMIAAQARIAMQVTRVLRAGDDLAMLYNDWSGHYTDADGARVEIAGEAIEVVRRQADGAWLFALDDPYARG